MKVCPGCGEENPDKAKFCLECATSLGETSSSRRRERRVVSVLFCDLVGFTARSERSDIEDVERFLHGYHGLLRRELERHGGTVEKFIGDAVMALFGAPVAHEDDSERAVRAALAIQDAVGRLRERDGLDVHVRIGVTTGEALVSLGANAGAGEGMATGDVVNTAARIQSAAAVDGVLVGEATYRATDRVIVYEDAEPVMAKGKAEPVLVWKAVEPRSLLPEQARVDDLRLVGRESEVASLVAALDRSAREPSTQLVTVVGAPGIGKTRLVEELGVHVEDQPRLIRWRRGRSLAYGEGVAFWALGEMVKAEAGILESDTADVAERKLHAAAAAVMVDERDREWAVRQLRPLVGVETETTSGVESGRAESFAAWRRFLEALAEEAPTVLVFEDVHWADDALLDFIDLLAERAGAVPLLIVCTARPELLERRAGWGGGKTNTQTLLLTPLSDGDTARLVGELLDQALLPAETQQALLERAQGNPLYAQEYVRMLRDRGMLVRDGRGWRLAGPPEGLPESVQAIIAARLDTLTEHEHRLIQDAAVVGKTAWLGAVCAISDTPAWQAEELLHGLERKQLLRRARRGSVAGEIEFSFAHALTQEVAYGQIRRPDRARKHERAAQWIDQLSGERDDKAELLAHHYTTALTLRRLAGGETEALAGKARAALVEAGHQAQAVNAHAAASRHLAAALELTPAGDTTRPRLLLEYVSARYHAGTADEDMLRAALDAQEAAADWCGAAEACLLLADWLDVYAGRAADAEDMETRGYDYATRGSYSHIASNLAGVRAYRLLVSGSVDHVLRFSEQAMRRAEEAGDEPGAAMLMMWHGWGLVLNDDADGVDRMRDAAETLAQHTHPKTTTAYHNLGEALITLGGFPKAAQAHAEAARWAERFGGFYDIGAEQVAVAEDAYHLGDWGVARNVAVPLLDHPSGAVSAGARWVHGRIARARGDPGTAMEDANRLLAYAEGGNEELLFHGFALSALAHDASGDRAAASEMADRFFRHWADLNGFASQAPALAEVAVACAPRDDVRRAAILLPDVSGWKPAILAIADERYVDAAARFAAIGSRPLEAAASLMAAQHAAGLGQSGQTAEFAERALTLYHQLGATAYTAAAQAVAAQARPA